MVRGATIFLQVVVVIIGIGILAFLLWEPQVEGRNVQATQFQIYFNDPFLAYAYAGSIAFFLALYKSFLLLGYIGQNKVFSLASVRALRTIKYCAFVILGFIVPAVAYLLVVRPGDDIAGGVAMGSLISFITLLVAAVATLFESIIQSGVHKTSGEDLSA